MTSVQGMADYFYKAATENPNSIHGTEHMTEVNNVGASLGLGCGILGGTPGYETKNRIGPPGSMNWQRIKRASPVSNALHSPNGAFLPFPMCPVSGKARSVSIAAWTRSSGGATWRRSACGSTTARR